MPKPQNLNQDESFEQENSHNFETETKNLKFQLQKSVTLKKINQKSINGNMLLSLAIDYVAILQPPKPDFSKLETCIDKAVSEETERQHEFFYSEFEQYLRSYKPDLPQKSLKQVYQRELAKFKSNLRTRLSDILPFETVCVEVREFEKRAEILC